MRLKNAIFVRFRSSRKSAKYQIFRDSTSARESIVLRVFFYCTVANHVENTQRKRCTPKCTLSWLAYTYRGQLWKKLIFRRVYDCFDMCCMSLSHRSRIFPNGFVGTRTVIQFVFITKKLPLLLSSITIKLTVN